MAAEACYDPRVAPEVWQKMKAAKGDHGEPVEFVAFPPLMCE